MGKWFPWHDREIAGYDAMIARNRGYQHQLEADGNPNAAAYDQDIAYLTGLRDQLAADAAAAETRMDELAAAERQAHPDLYAD
jgi:hypothetical protein